MAFRLAPSPAKRSGVTMIVIPANNGNATLALYVSGDKNQKLRGGLHGVPTHSQPNPAQFKKSLRVPLGKGAHQNSERFV